MKKKIKIYISVSGSVWLLSISKFVFEARRGKIWFLEILERFVVLG